jgi:hypothetical protein
MKTKSFVSALLLLFFCISAYSQNPSFNGEWRINKEKSAVPSDQLYLSRINLNLKGDSLLTTRVYESPDGQQYPFDEKIALNGNESKIVIYDMPRAAKAQKNPDGSVVMDTKTTFYGNGGEDNLTAKETWKVNSEGRLVMDFVNQMSGQEFRGTFYYDKVK